MGPSQMIKMSSVLMEDLDIFSHRMRLQKTWGKLLQTVEPQFYCNISKPLLMDTGSEPTAKQSRVVSLGTGLKQILLM